MKKYFYLMSLMVGLLVSGFALSACGDDDDDNDYSNSSYFLSYRGEEQTPYLDWDNSMKTSFLRLEFDEGIPKGSVWNIYCGESWVKIRNIQGKVNAHYENIQVTIEDNTNYEDREAYIYLDVENGLPTSSNYTTVTIHQYGYNQYLDYGQELSFDTDRSLANNNTMKLNISSMDNVVEVDWGDNTKELFNTKQSYRTLTHQYTSSIQTYRVKLRFGTGYVDNTANCYFSFYTDRNQGVTKFYDRNGRNLSSYSDSSAPKYVTYKDGKFSFK